MRQAPPRRWVAVREATSVPCRGFAALDPPAGCAWGRVGAGAEAPAAEDGGAHVAALLGFRASQGQEPGERSDGAVRPTRVWKRLFGLRGAVIEGVEFEDGGALV